MTRQVAIVSGGSRGLGAAIVKDLCTNGYRVATFSRNTTPALDELRRTHDVFWQVVDARDGAASKDFVKRVFGTFGRIDALVNSAAISLDGMLTLTSPADIKNLLAVNVEAPILLTHACAKVMLARGSGAIVNVSSVNAVRGHAGVAVYSAAKAALDGLTRSLARELGPRNVRVNSIAPGYFESDMVKDMDAAAKERIAKRTPLGRLGRTDDIVGAVRFLLSKEAAFITGQTLVVDGGLTC